MRLAAIERTELGATPRPERTAPVRVLVIEDNPGDADLVREALDGDTGDWELDHASCLAEGVAALHARKADVVLLDLSLPDASGLQGVRQIVRLKPDVPLVVLTGIGDAVTGTRAVQEGAQEYLLKGELDRRVLGRVLGRVLRYAIERHALSQRASSSRASRRPGRWQRKRVAVPWSLPTRASQSRPRSKRERPWHALRTNWFLVWPRAA
jgi:DNA-binding NarL/FixJ family response regulator